MGKAEWETRFLSLYPARFMGLAGFEFWLGRGAAFEYAGDGLQEHIAHEGL